MLATCAKHFHFYKKPDLRPSSERSFLVLKVPYNFLNLTNKIAVKT